MMNEKNTYISRGALLKRAGWSSGAIKVILGEPDKTEPNAKNSEKTRQLYALEKVTKAEASGKLARVIERINTREEAKTSKSS